MRKYLFAALLLLPIFCALSAPAEAYVGPGAGLSAIGSFLSLLGAFFFAIVGFVWYPVRRLFRKRPSQGVDEGK